MAEITDERLDDLEGCEEWFDYLLRELEDLTDSLDEHVTISDVHEAIRSLTVRMRNGGRPESHDSAFEAKLQGLRDRLEGAGYPLDLDPETDVSGSGS